MLTLERPAKRRSRPTQAVPDVLIYEVIDGRPLYYRGYGDVLKGKKTTEEIMGASGLQAFIIDYLLHLCHTRLNWRQYVFLTNEIGNHLGKKNNISGDLYIYERQALAPDKINNQYVDVPPKIAIEVDVRIDLTDEKNADYVHRKTQKLLDWGVEKVIWIFTNTRKVTVAETGKDWITMDWHREIILLDGQLFNIGAYLEQEGIRLEEGNAE